MLGEAAGWACGRVQACLQACNQEAPPLPCRLQAMAPDGRSLVVGGSRGRLQQYDIVAAEPATGAAEQPAAHQEQREQQGAPAARIDEGSRRDLVRLDSSHSDTVDCLRFLPGGRLASKSNDGRMCVWQCKDSSSGGGGGGGNNGSSSSSSTELEALASWKIPHCSSSGGWASRCQFGATRDGRYIAAVRHLLAWAGRAPPPCTPPPCAAARRVTAARRCHLTPQGNSRGDCYVFDAESGERVGYVSAIRVSGGWAAGAWPVHSFAYRWQSAAAAAVASTTRHPTPAVRPPSAPGAAPVRACGLSEDCRHLLAVLGKGFIFRCGAGAVHTHRPGCGGGRVAHTQAPPASCSSSPAFRSVPTAPAPPPIAGLSTTAP